MISSVELKTNIMNKTELIDKLLHLGSTTEICNSTQTSKKAKELAHKLLDEYLAAINYTHCCKSDSEQLPSFLYKSDGGLYFKHRENTDVTEHWNEYLKTR